MRILLMATFLIAGGFALDGHAQSCPSGAEALGACGGGGTPIIPSIKEAGKKFDAADQKDIKAEEAGEEGKSKKTLCEQVGKFDELVKNGTSKSDAAVESGLADAKFKGKINQTKLNAYIETMRQICAEQGIPTRDIPGVPEDAAGDGKRKPGDGGDTTTDDGAGDGGGGGGGGGNSPLDMLGGGQGAGQGGNPLQGVMDKLMGGMGGGGGGQGGDPQDEEDEVQTPECPTGYTVAIVNGLKACVSDDAVGGGSGSTACLQVNDTKYCPSSTCTASSAYALKLGSTYVCPESGKVEDALADKAGYLDSSRKIGDGCGMGVDPRFTENAAYLEGYARGLKDCRDGQATPVDGSPTTVVDDIGDIKVLAQCSAALDAVAASIKVSPAMLRMAFRTQASLNADEASAFGFDETVQLRVLRAKTFFDAGKADGFTEAAANTENRGEFLEAYGQGFACGGAL